MYSINNTYMHMYVFVLQSSKQAKVSNVARQPTHFGKLLD